MAAQNGKHDSVLEATGATARLARVYAEALVNAAGDQADAIGDDLDVIVIDVLGQHPTADQFLASGAVNRKTKAAVLKAAFGEGVPPVLRNFLGVLNENNRLGLLRAVAAAYHKLRDEAAGRVRVTVTSAATLSDDHLAQLRQTLAGQLNAEPVLDTRTDPELLGGLVVQIGDRVYDSSVRTRLDSLRTHLMASGSYGSA